MDGFEMTVMLGFPKMQEVNVKLANNHHDDGPE